MNPEWSELALLLARRELWRLLSIVYLDPYHRERFAELRHPEYRQRVIQAASLVAAEYPVPSLGPGEIDPGQLSPRRLFDALDEEWTTLESSYRQVFGATAVSTNCPACGGEYEPNRDITYRAQRMADIAGFYSAFGLEVSSRAGERLDHVTIEAEFLYVLLAKEAAARQAGNMEGAEICRDARRQFISEHVGWWLPAFARVLTRLAPAPFYRELAAFTAALAAAERSSLALPPFHVCCGPKPAPVEAAANCLECTKPGTRTG